MDELDFKASMPPMAGRYTQDEIERFEAEEAERKRRSRIDKAGIPKAHRTAKLEEVDSEIQEYAKRVLDGAHESLFIYGKNGRGKTYQACAVLKALAANGRVLFRRLQTVFDDYMGTNDKQAVLDNVRFVPFLVIDDFGKESNSKWATALVFEIVAERIENERVTIFTSNLTPNQLFMHLTSNGGDQSKAEAVISRLKLCTPYEMLGEDRRLS